MHGVDFPGQGNFRQRQGTQRLLQAAPSGAVHLSGGNADRNTGMAALSVDALRLAPMLLVLVVLLTLGGSADGKSFCSFTVCAAIATRFVFSRSSDSDPQHDTSMNLP